MMSKRPFVSVVMPIYNVEQYLRKAIESVLAQTYADFEIILVNDCSPDNSLAICEEYASKYENIHVLNLLQNGGVSNARNQGQKMAKGQYLYFMDPDDYIDNILFETVKKSIEEHPSKLVVFGAVEDYFDDEGVVRNRIVIEVEAGHYASKESVRKELVKLEEKTLLGYPWNKFYDLDYLNSTGVQFEDHALLEDIIFNLEYTKEIDTMTVLNITPYHYMHRMNQSLTHKFVPEYYELHYRRVRTLHDEYLEWGLMNEENERFFANRMFRYLLSAIERNCDKRSGMDLKEQRKWIKELYKDEWICRMLSVADYKRFDMNLLIAIFRNRLTPFILLLGKLIYFVKNGSPILFSKIKQR